jgi:fructose-bisphosphate aldolase class I
VDQTQFDKIRSARGFVAALDQSGGSTPGALERYGIGPSVYSSDAEMFDLVHAMRSRIITSPSFGGDRILAAILFEDTMDREIDGRLTASYLWDEKRIVPFLKVDKGLAPEADGARAMKPIPALDDLLTRAVDRGVFGTKMRSVIERADERGIDTVVDQQFDVAARILEAGLVPIIEPEIDIRSPQKAEAEELLLTALVKGLDQLALDQHVMLKLTPPEIDDHYLPLVEHPRALRIVALSGGYSREEANARLARQHGVVASFSRALTEGLSVDQTPADFDAALDAAIASIFAASTT